MADSSSSTEFGGIIGIDLGTTYSCVSVFIDGSAQVIPNDQGRRTTPSRVALQMVDGKPNILVGQAAMNLSAQGAKNVVYDAKRVIGRKFSDKEVQSDAKIWPFTIEKNDANGGGVILIAQHGGVSQRWEPEEVSALLLSYLKGCAERYLGKTVTKAVITVPAYFNDAQRERTKAAGQIAGLEVMRIINEPTAAALAYGIGSPQAPTDTKNVLVFDFGGGTFDVSVITIDCGTFEVRSTAGDTHLGGQDIDGRLVEYIVAEAKKKYGKDISTSSRALAKLRLRCEAVKRSLSHTMSETVLLDEFLGGGLDNDDDGADERSVTISQAKFNDLMGAAVFKKCLDIVGRAISDAKMTKHDMDEVILVGGSSRIPKLQSLLSEYFGGKALCHAVNPDEAVAVGAAIQGSILSDAPEQKSEKTDGLLLMDVVSLSIGVEVEGGKFDILVPRNTTIPYSITREFVTASHQQENVDIEVFEGERPLVKHNHRLGEFRLEGITKAKKGAVTIIVGFSVDENGMLTVTAEEVAKAGKEGKKKSLAVSSGDRLSTEDVARMVARAQQSAEEDSRAIGLLDAVGPLKGMLDDLLVAVERLAGSADKLAAAQRKAKGKGGDDTAADADADAASEAEADGAEGSSPTEVAALLAFAARKSFPSKARSKLTELRAPLTWLVSKAGAADSAADIKSKTDKLSAMLEKALRGVAKLQKKTDKKVTKARRAGQKRRRDSDSDYSGSDDDDDDDGSDDDESDDLDDDE